MLKLKDIEVGAQIRGIQVDEIVRVVQVEPIGDNALTVYYKDNQGRISEQMLFRSDEARLELAEVGRPWAFDAPGRDFKLGLEAHRINLAHLFDPMMAVHTSNVEPLPHQISAVYEDMLPRQPLRFVLADDPGAGKTIMAGLLIRELLMRADARRILVVTPGAIAEQWQDELLEKFNVQFEVFSREKQEQCASGNYFNEQDQLICRLDQLSRNEEYIEKLNTTRWDLIIVDEAHKLSANYYGNKVNKTKRFKLGEILGAITRHFLLITATPHNGKEEDFQIWLSLLDQDRFYGKFREAARKVDVSDMMRRMVKEDLLKFDRTPLFPERRAASVNYELSNEEAALYTVVTDYVRNEMNRADNLDGKRRGTVGFALTQLQRRLASSPAAIYQSLKRRRGCLESRLRELKLLNRGRNVQRHDAVQILDKITIDHQDEIPDNLDELDDTLSAEKYELYTEQIVDQVTAAETISDLETEIQCLKKLENEALKVVQSGNDKKWEELSHLLQDRSKMYTDGNNRRKLIIFTEHLDTLTYLVDRIGGMLGRPEAVISIHGRVNRDDRYKRQEEFRNNPDVVVLVATDAAGEGVNLQNANLMINYDLPWNPNRLEQRFGRIHRIGQIEVCHLWNLIAKETREGDVFQRLFDKLEVEKQALGGKVFDILGEAFENRPLKDMLIEAIRYGGSPNVQAKLYQAIEGALDTEHLKEVLHRNALVPQQMSLEELYSVKEEMEKAEARKLQPYFVRAFFTESFQNLSGELRPREPGRFEIRHVPAAIRERDRVIGESRNSVLKKYERICFEKDLIRIHGKPMAELMHPGHPLMHAVTDLVLSIHRHKLKQGAVLVNPSDDGLEPRILFMLDHSVREAKGAPPRVVSRRLQFVEVDQHATIFHAGWAPHLDLQPIDDNDIGLVQDILNAPWINLNLESLALNHASSHLVPEHYQEIKDRRSAQVDKVLSAVNERLVPEINYWQDRYIKLKNDVDAGKQPQMQSEMARRQVDDLTERLEQRRRELLEMKSVVSSTPVVIGGALVIPQGLLAQRKGDSTFCVDAEARLHIETVAMNAVMNVERSFGYEVKDVSDGKCGWDITSRPPANQEDPLMPDRHIEVKGRAQSQNIITVSRNEIIYALNQRNKFLLAIVIVDGDSYEGPYYIRNPFDSEPDIGVASINFKIEKLLSKAVSPEQTI